MKYVTLEHGTVKCYFQGHYLTKQGKQSQIIESFGLKYNTKQNSPVHTNLVSIFNTTT